MTAAASAVHEANSDVLIFFSGLESDFNIEPAVGGSTILDPAFSFSVAEYEWAGKLVFEMHEYDEGISSSCSAYESILLSFGADATTKTGTGANRAPLVITEWGHDETDASGAYNSSYSTCLTQFMVDRQFGWMLWVLAGSYYIRSGVQDSDESYGEYFSITLVVTCALSRDMLTRNRYINARLEFVSRHRFYSCCQTADPANICCLRPVISSHVQTIF